MMYLVCISVKVENFFSVSSQVYETHILPESVIHGNDAILKCSIPSFVVDFVSIAGWIDSEGNQLGGRNLASSLTGNY